MSDGAGTLYFRQLWSGRDVAVRHPAAAQMANFMYLVGDPGRRSAFVVDPAWDVDGLVAVAEADGYSIDGALITHYHPDHVGGDLFGLPIEGVARLLELRDVPLYVNRHEAAGLRQVTGVSASDLRLVDSDDRIEFGAHELRFLHTPGHTPGSQCFLIDGRLIAGDTLFVGGCGRVDLPGGDADALYHSLTQRLARLPAGTVLYPGHHYGSEPTSTIGREQTENIYLNVPSLEAWHRLLGHP